MDQQQSQQQDMNLKATVELLVHFQSMRNIDLFHQGIYQLKVQVYQQTSDKKLYAIPYNVLHGEIPHKKSGTSKYYREALLQDNSFFSKAFAIRYCEEIIDLNDMCIFRADFIDAYPGLEEGNFYMVVDLIFVELAMQHSEELFKHGPESGTKVVATFKSKLHQTFNGIHEFVPLTFDEMHFCCVNATVHSVLRDFTFKSIPEHHPIEIIDNENEKSDKKQDKKGKDGRKQGKKQDQGKFNGQKPANFREFLSIITQGFQRHLLDDFYQNYVKFLRVQHENFLTYYLALIEDSIQNPKKAVELKTETQKNFSAPFQKLLEKKQKDFLKNHKQQNSLSTNEQEEQQLIYSLMLNSNFSDYFNLDKEEDFNIITQEIQSEINTIAGCSYQLWYTFCYFIKDYIDIISTKMQEDYQDKVKKRWNESIFKKTHQVSNLSDYTQRHAGKDHEKDAKKIRNKPYYQTLAPLNVEDISLFPKADIHPIIYHDIFQKVEIQQQQIKQQQIPKQSSDFSNDSTKDLDDDDDETNIPDDEVNFADMRTQSQITSNIKVKNPNYDIDKKQVHVMVMVHGYQGNNYDMRLFKDNIALLNPDIQFLSSSINEEHTDGDIWDMGKRLSEEIKKFIQEWCPNGCTKLSFIGHSLGGLIIRSAIPHLQQYHDIFHTLLTLSSPHLGFLYHSSKMVETGLWVMKTWKKCQSIKQMTLSDSKELENTFIYKLAHKGSLDHFKNIVLVSSYQDSYVPFYSARIQRNPKTDSSDSNKSKRYSEILEAILGKVNSDKIHRIDVSYEIQGKNLDSMIGRAAHIQFLENMALQKIFAYNFSQFFE